MLNKKTIGKRIFDRKKYGVNILFVHNNQSFSGKIKDISLSGVFVATPHVHLFSKNDLVLINIPFVNQQSHVSRNGRIVRITAEGIAVKFL